MKLQMELAVMSTISKVWRPQDGLDFRVCGDRTEGSTGVVPKSGKWEGREDLTRRWQLTSTKNVLKMREHNVLNRGFIILPRAHWVLKSWDSIGTTTDNGRKIEEVVCIKITFSKSFYTGLISHFRVQSNSSWWRIWLSSVNRLLSRLERKEQGL